MTTTATLSDREVEHIAWTVLVCALAGFLILLIGLPALGYWFVNNATDGHETDLTVLSGTVIVEIAGRDPSGEQKQRMVPEGATIRTDSNTRVELKLFDGSSVIVFPDSQLTLNAARSPKFSISKQPYSAWLTLARGRMRLSVGAEEQVAFSVDTPHGTSDYTEGSYSLEVTSDQSEVVVRSGQAHIATGNGTLVLSTRERGQLHAGEQPRGPFPAQRDLIVDGAFQATLDNWRAYNDQGGDGGQVDGEVQPATDSGRKAVRFVRHDSQGNHDDAGIEQVINKDVTDADVVRLHLDLRVNGQSLSGCGYVSSECPVMVKIRYRDVKGGENLWVHGFFAQNPEGKPIKDADQVPLGLWYPYESEDLTDILNPKPAQILSVQLYASGWDFDSLVSDAGLIVE